MKKADVALLCGASVLSLGAAAAALVFILHEHRFPVKNYFYADPRMGYDIRENVPPSKYYETKEIGDYMIWSNELGCYDEPYAGPGGPARAHVLLVGDSFTQGATFEGSWGKTLQELTGRRVLKCGVTGSGLRQELLKAEKTIGKTGVAPRLIVVGYFMNDLEEDYLFPPRTVIGGWVATLKRIGDYETGAVAETPYDVKEREVQTWEREGGGAPCRADTPARRLGCWLYRRTALYYGARNAVLSGWRAARSVKKTAGSAVPPYIAWQPVEGRPWLKKAWEDHLANLNGFKKLAGAQGSKLLVVVIPAREQVYGFLGDAAKAGYPGLDPELPNRFVRERLRRENIEILDLTSPFHLHADQTARPHLDAEKDLYYRYNGHWNLNGQRLAGLLTARHILEKRMISAPERDVKLAAIERELSR